MVTLNDRRRVESGPETNRNESDPVNDAWDYAVEQFHELIVPLPRGPLAEARRRYLSFCQRQAGNDRLAEAAPLVAFGFLTKAAFEDARRKTRIFG
jgi:hypothetical protein